jgi:uncharacterized protein YgbK (DUF1537 family)
LARFARTAFAARAAGHHIVIDAAGESREQIRTLAAEDSAAMVDESRRLQRMLADAVITVLRQGPTSGLVLFGGDTALGVCRRIGVGAIELAAEVEPFVPLGRSLTGEFAGLPVVTKAGGFGGEQIVAAALGLLS